MRARLAPLDAPRSDSTPASSLLERLFFAGCFWALLISLGSAANNVHGEATVAQLFMRSVGLYGYKDFLGESGLRCCLACLDSMHSNSVILHAFETHISEVFRCFELLAFELCLMHVDLHAAAGTRAISKDGTPGEYAL